MNGRHAICLVVDGLRASALGAYGNTTSPTPQLDTLASRSAVVEWFLADSPHLDRFCRSVWQGSHAARQEIPAGQSSVLETLKQDGVELRLVTDEPCLTQQPEFNQFEQVEIVEPTAEQPAERIADTAMAHFCTAAVEKLELWQADGAGSLSWVHMRGLFGPWDAPSALRAEILDEEDPPAAEFLDPPGALRDVVDPDVLLVHRAAYAAQMAVADACLGALCCAIDEIMADRETLVMLLGSRGFALGEHGSIGGDCCELFGERLHLPWLLHVCDDQTPRPRLTGLAQPADVGATLLDWFGLQPDGHPCDGQSVLPQLKSGTCTMRELAVAEGDQCEQAVRTPAWLLRQDGSGDQRQLFAKADDRWECNDVAALCPEVVDRLCAALADFEQHCRDGLPLPTASLDDELVRPQR